MYTSCDVIGVKGGVQVFNGSWRAEVSWETLVMRRDVRLYRCFFWVKGSHQGLLVLCDSIAMLKCCGFEDKIKL